MNSNNIDEKEENRINFHKRQDNEVVKPTRYIILTLLWIFCIIASLFSVRYLAQRVEVNGNSMNPTLVDGDTLLLDKLHKENIKRFDIIVFDHKGNHFIKRVIGLPGESVEIKENKIWINGKELEGDVYHKKNVVMDMGDITYPVSLSDHQYFCIGDNREDSFDSRYQEVGPVDDILISGKIVFRYSIFPLEIVFF